MGQPQHLPLPPHPPLPRQFQLPSLYAILDTQVAAHPIETAEALLRGGIKLLQYRHKGPLTRKRWEECSQVADFSRKSGALFIVNDRLDLALMTNADGVHLGQDDIPPEAARKLLGPGKIIGVSTHHPAQTAAADASPAKVDYIAIGPVFETRSKADPDAVVGLNGVSAARRATSKPLVAIGGITRETAVSVIGAGADSMAVIRDLLTAKDVEASAREFVELLARS